MIYELSLFSGAGGGVLASKLLGHIIIGYVENDDYCQRVLQARIADGHLDDAPIYGDIRAFISEGYAESYQGMVDVVSGGFPCQPFSHAGKRAGADDPRNMWPQTLAVLRAVRPRYAFLENVPGLLAHEYARRIFADLAASGFDARWRVLSAAECGAPHKRDRVWIVAEHQEHGRGQGRAGRLDTSGEGQQQPAFRNPSSQGQPVSPIHAETSGVQGDVADAARISIDRSGGAGEAGRDEHTDGGEDVADANSVRCQGPRRPVNAVRAATTGKGQADRPWAISGRCVKSDVGGMAHGFSAILDIFRTTGIKRNPVMGNRAGHPESGNRNKKPSGPT